MGGSIFLIFAKAGSEGSAFHFAGIDIGYCHMEKMANLDKIGQPSGFKVACFPIKIKL